ncbi:MAG TPA: Mur ligase family protein, partial [Saprospiraceae bacterium]|nr:Mur ligase family protein [Saprospiraceae bacterium]
MKVHLIAIGGAVMHNLALAMHNKGFIVTGSDDDIQSPSKERLIQAGLFPGFLGWNEDNITTDLDLVVLGMHARKDNPELIKALSLNLKVQSFPEFIGEAYKDKLKIVIAGSHGKTTTTSMIMYILKSLDKKFDYLVGSNIDGFDTMVSLTDAPVAVIEGDEYLSSPLDMRSKFLHYNPDIAIITGIAWDHINVFPTYSSYLDTFKEFINSINKEGHLIFYKPDEDLKKLLGECDLDIELIPYAAFPHRISKDGRIVLTKDNKEEVEIELFGQHNLENFQAAYHVCRLLGCGHNEIIDSIRSFTGAGRRLEKIREEATFASYIDFAHAPSKLRSTVNAVKERYPNRKLIATYELHTFSSLNPEFLSEYKNSMKRADIKIVFYNEHSFKIKKMPVLDPNFVKEAFGDKDLL